MEKLINDIKKWGIDKGIDKCDPLLQTTKTLEECMELQRAIIRAESVTTEYEGAIFPSKDYQTMEELKPYIPPKELTDIKDAIGDIFITLVMLSIQNEMILQKDWFLDTNERINEFFDGDSSMDTSRYILEQISELQYFYSQGTLYTNMSGYIVNGLINICNLYNLTLKQCVEYAYNEIKDRKGSIVDGLWEKEQ